MALSFPHPARPSGGTREQLQAYRLWQAGQGHATRQAWPDAAASYARAIGLHDSLAYGLAAAHALIRCGRAEEAATRARAIRTAHPQHILAYTLEANALVAQEQPEQALSCLQSLPAQVTPDHPYLSTLATVLQKLRRHDESIPVFMQALALKMDDPHLHYHLGTAFREQGLKAEAAECVRTALLMGVGSSELAARGQLVFLEREACRWREAEDEMARLRPALQALEPGQPMETSAFVHAVLVDDPLEQLKVSRHYALHVARKVQPLPAAKPGASGERLRVGYLSADFHNHATSQLLVNLLEHHDRRRFEISCLSTGPDDGSAMRRRIAAAAERFEDLRRASHQAVAQRARELGIHILIDLKGATYDTLLPVLACRPAPVQASWLGFPGSTGAPYIDYLIGDPLVTPLAHAAHFSEQIAQLPHCYQPNDALRALPRASRRSDCGAPEDGLLLCAFHQSYKISEPVFDLWCALLAARPDARLWLLRWNTNVESALRAAARARGIDDGRLLFAPLLPLQQHLDRLACADLYLDTWPCNAHTTASEALWAGVPVITLQGASFAQRVASSLLHAVQLDELVCHDAQAYRTLALALADDAPRRAALREHLQAQRRSSPLFDAERQARDLEALLQRMWQRALHGLPPAPLAAQAAQGEA